MSAQAVARLIRSGDPDHIRQGVELVAALRDPELNDRLLRGVAFDPEPQRAGWGAWGRFTPNDTFSGTGRLGGHRQNALLRVLATADGAVAQRLRAEATSLKIHGASGERLSVPELSGFPNLERLSLGSAQGVVGLAAAARAPALRSLELNPEPGPAGLRALAGAPALEQLVVFGESLERLDGLESIPTLRLFAFRGSSLRSAAALAALPRLERVVLSPCPGLQDADALRHIPRLDRSDKIGVARVRLAWLSTTLASRALDALETAAGRARCAEALERLDLDRIEQHFPRSSRGEVSSDPLDRQVLLQRLEDAPGESARWLAVTARHDRRGWSLRLEIHTARRGRNPHCWERALWRWRRDVERPAWQRKALAELGGNAIARLAELEARCFAGGGSRKERIACCVLMQDVGRVEDALALFDVALDTSDFDWAGAAWGGGYGQLVLRAWMARCAPWAIARLAREDAARAARRGQVAPDRILLPLGPIRDGVRPVLRLTADRDGAAPRLSLSLTGRMDRAAEDLWLCPQTWDRDRFSPDPLLW